MITVKIQRPGKSVGYASIERHTDDRTEFQKFNDDMAVITTPIDRVGIVGAKFIDDDITIEIIDSKNNKYTFQIIG